VHALFARHQVPDRERSKLVEKLLGLSYHAAHRRVTGLLPWTFEELAQVAAHYGESVADVVVAEQAEEAQEAVFALGAFQEKCRVWLGGVVEPTSEVTLVAVQEPTGWVVKPATQAAAGAAPTFIVKRVMLQPSFTNRPKRVAVLDDNVDVAENVCICLRGVGFDAVPYFTLDTLISAMHEQPFDAYIVDWLLGTGTARRLLADVRAQNPHCPIVVLTGKARSGDTDVGDLASALATYKAMFYEKPAQTAIITAALSEALRER
jgi:CheY-like chemotaxis protein